MKIVFMGTPEFAVPSLKALIDSGEDVVAVVTQPDKPKGRGRKLVPPPTKILAEKHGIAVLQPSKIKTGEFLDELKSLEPELICVTAYGKILPKQVLDLPKHGCINVHASLLPELRGAAPINWAIIRGHKTAGITTMLMDEGMDTGDMLLWREINIEDDDTTLTLSEKLSQIGGELLIETIRALMDGSLNPQKQDDSKATLAPMLKKEDGRIDWSRPAGEISNLVRGLNPWPGTFTTYNGKLFKIYKAKPTSLQGPPGEVLKASGNEFVIGTADGALALEEIQLEGGKRLDAATFLRGRRVEQGEKLG